MTVEKTKIDSIVALCKRRGIIFSGSGIYGGLANSYDYGPLGVELLNNIKEVFWKHFVHDREDIVGIDSAILMNSKIWEASGHVEGFNDPLMDCKRCKARVRADKLIEECGEKRPRCWAGEKTPLEALYEFVISEKLCCPHCDKSDWSEPKQFNLMFKTVQGVTRESGMELYLRPETAQGIFVNFKNVVRSHRMKLPFGIAQIGKAFRNEITPRNFIFRTREFEQMEIEFFFDPRKDDWKRLMEKWKTSVLQFLTGPLAISESNLRLRDHDPGELSHYSQGTTDVEFRFPFGWAELCAAGAYRGDYDLRQHQDCSGESLEYFDQDTGDKILPHVIEPSIGVGRIALAVLLDAYQEEKVPGEETRTLMRFSPLIAPVKIAVLPLMKKDGLPEKAREIMATLSGIGNIDYDHSGLIGKRYRRQDEIGTPVCVTIDYETLKTDTVTVRDRDTMKQKRVKISCLTHFLVNNYFTS